MYIATHHRTLVAYDLQTQTLRQIKAASQICHNLVLVDVPEDIVTQLRSGDGERGIPSTRVSWEEILEGCQYLNINPKKFTLRKNGFFACAERDSDLITFNREAARLWEQFEFVSHGDGLQLIQPPRTREHFAAAVATRLDQGKPVRLHFGCGSKRINGFLNVDRVAWTVDTNVWLQHFENYFVFDFANQPWPIPDQCVDYIFSEDFIEHIPQKLQIAFLAESFRVLKPGCFNRVNTPCLRYAMTRSNFAKGFAGVYFTEYDK